MEKPGKNLTPFGVEYLEEVALPPDHTFGSDDMSGDPACCTTFMSYIAGGGDVGDFECVVGVDMCTQDLG